MRKTYLIIAIIVFTFKVNSQNQIESVFKTLLILDEVIYLDNETRTESNIELLINNINLEISEIKITNNKASYIRNFIFYQFDINKNEIIYKSELPIIFKLGNCSN